MIPPYDDNGQKVPVLSLTWLTSVPFFSGAQIEYACDGVEGSSSTNNIPGNLMGFPLPLSPTHALVVFFLPGNLPYVPHIWF